MAISTDNTYLTNYALDAGTVSADKVTSQIRSADTDDETMEACKQFESYMIQQMYKNMEKTAKLLTEDEGEDDGGGSAYLDMFSDNFLEGIVDNMMNSGQGLGIAEKLYESIKTNQGETVNK